MSLRSHAGWLVRGSGRRAGIPGKHGLAAAHNEEPGQLAPRDYPGVHTLQAPAGVSSIALSILSN